MKAMCDYAIEAADWSTELPHLDFAVSERGRREERRVLSVLCKLFGFIH